MIHGMFSQTWHFLTDGQIFVGPKNQIEIGGMGAPINGRKKNNGLHWGYFYFTPISGLKIIFGRMFTIIPGCHLSLYEDIPPVGVEGLPSHMFGYAA